MLADCFGLKGLISAVLNLWQAEHENLCPAWVPYTCGTSVKTPCHARVLKSPWWWACTRANSNGIHRAECSTGVQAHKEPKELQTVLADCFGLKGLISAVLNLWQAEHENLCPAWVPYTCGTSVKTPCHARVLKSPWWWACTRANSNGIHRAECSTGVQAHKEPKELQTVLADCFGLKGLISAVLNLWQAEHENLCPAWVPYTCGTSVKTPCHARVLKSPWWWACTRANSNGIHRAECSTGVQAHKEPKELQTVLADCFGLKGLISAVLNLWQAEHENLCPAWVPYTCGTSVKTPCHARVLKSPWWWACTRANSNGIHRAECSTGVQAHKEPKELQTVLADCFGLKGLISAVLNLWQAEHENLCPAWVPYTCGTSVKTPCHARVLKSPWWWACTRANSNGIHRAECSTGVQAHKEPKELQTVLADCFGLKGLISAVLNLWQAEHENLCPAWVPYTCGTSVKTPCHARVLKSPWWWACTRANSNGIHRAECSTGVQAHKEPKELQTVLADCFGLKGLISAVLNLWQAEHENLCPAWVPYTCGTSVKTPCHARVLKSPWWWACTRANSNGIHRAECSTGVQAHKEPKELQTVLADCFGLKGLISAVLNLWQAEHENLCPAWVPYTCGTSVKTPCHARVLKSPWWWACTRANSNGIHWAECSTGVQAHKEPKELQTVLADCFGLKGLISAVLNLWQAEHENLCPAWVPYTW